jgi:tetratricopeptide (TPR) repeat protein
VLAAAGLAASLSAQTPAEVEALAAQGVAQLRSGRTRDAVGTLRQAIALRPEAARVRFLLGLALYQAGDWREARTELAHALAANPADGQALHLDGLCRLKLGDLRGGAEALEQSLRANPSNGAAALTLATTYVALREVEKAESLLDGPLRNAEPAPQALLRGMILNVRGRYREAEPELRKGIAADPRLPGLHNQLGYTQMLLGDYPAAIRAFEEELKLVPNDFHACANLGWLFVQEREYERAKPFLAEASKHAPANAGLLYLVAQVRWNERDFAAAAQALEKAVEIEPGFRAAHVLLARVYGRQNRPEDVARQQTIIARLTAAEQERNLESSDGYGARTLPLPEFAGKPR